MIKNLFFLLLVFPLTATAAFPSFQALIDATPAGGTLRPKPGTYAGPATISRQIAIDGGGKVTVDGGGIGSVLLIDSSRVVVRGLRLTNSGESHDRMDSGITLTGNENRIEDNVVEGTLFGISLKRANHNVLRRNRIRSKPAELAMRGESIRLWYSMDNLIEGNDIDQARDLVMMNSPRNRIVGNVIRNSRYGIHLFFSPDSVLEGNSLYHTATGIIVLNSDRVMVRRNLIFHSLGVSGAGLAFKMSAEDVADGNEIVHCAVGILADSPVEAAGKTLLRGNRIAHNAVGIRFYGERGGHALYGNSFENNLIHVAMFGSGDALANDFRGNYWDDYQGFDRNHDGIGDIPHELYAYTDRIWMEIPMARFFRNSPALELLDFLERLAPFSAPDLVLRDAAPVFNKPAWRLNTSGKTAIQ
ncbi:MAG: nitrous oxide reductase family maturation protein NosD [Betaproteobacteria bacterium]|nr:nitrous oxide reductase family maturation protein NosD [Betaproteobacteria bacterium]